MATEVTPIENDVSQNGDNAKAIADAQNVLAELKAEEKVEQAEPIISKETSESKLNEVSAEDQKPISKTQDDAPSSHTAKSSDRIQSNGVQGGRGAYRGRHKRASGHKGDMTSLPESDDPHEIRRQVEFYFSDSNLPLDKFLREQVGGSENKAVDLKLIHSFKRMRRFKPFSTIVSALKDSNFIDVIENEGENVKIKRKTPLAESQGEFVRIFEDRTMPRSIYAKGFGHEVPTTQFDIEAFFTPYGPTNAVRLRRADDKTFKGSVFVEFDSPETAEKFLNADPKPKWDGKELLIMSKKAYVEQKAEDIRTGKIKPRPFRGRTGNASDERSWKERREEDQKKGFKKGGGSRGFGSKGGRGGNRNSRDSRGVPQVKDSSKEAHKDPETVAALEKAKAVVEGGKAKKEFEEKKELDAEDTTTTTTTTAPVEDEPVGDEADKVDMETNGALSTPTATAGKKRPREEVDEAEAGAGAEEGEPETKKVATEQATPAVATSEEVTGEAAEG